MCRCRVSQDKWSPALGRRTVRIALPDCVVGTVRSADYLHLGRHDLYRVLGRGLGSLIEMLVASSCWDWTCRSWTYCCLPWCLRSRRALVSVLRICVAFLLALSPLVLVFLLVLAASLHPHPQMRILGLGGSAHSGHLVEACGCWCWDLCEKAGWAGV